MFRTMSAVFVDRDGSCICEIRDNHLFELIAEGFVEVRDFWRGMSDRLTEDDGVRDKLLKD